MRETRTYSFRLAAWMLGAWIVTATSSLADQQLEAVGPNGPLRGTLREASVGAPVVLIIPGSGPTDRDGNSPLGVRAAPYRLLAEQLGMSGISTVRIDKRGMFASKDAVADPNAVTISDYVADVAAWISAIRQATKQECVWLLGHSEGGLVALAAVQKVGNICGLLLVATIGRPLPDVLTEQLKANPANAPVLPQALAAIEALKTGNRVDTTGMHPGLLPLFRPQVQGFLIEAFSYDPAALARTYIGPMLVLQGGRDLQVSVADAEKLAGARQGSQLSIIADLNHVLKRVVSDDLAENRAAYGNPNLPLHDGVVSAISEFVKRAGR